MDFSTHPGDMERFAMAGFPAEESVAAELLISALSAAMAQQGNSMERLCFQRGLCGFSYQQK